MTKEGLKNLTLAGKIEGKRSRGRQRKADEGRGRQMKAEEGRGRLLIQKTIRKKLLEL